MVMRGNIFMNEGQLLGLSLTNCFHDNLKETFVVFNLFKITRIFIYFEVK